MTDQPMFVPPTITTWDGNVIAGTIASTAHRWTADGMGLFHTGTDLAAEWTSNYALMLHGHANLLTPLQRLEGNAEAAVENTKLAALSPSKLYAYREDLQREFDAIAAAQTINQSKYGIDPTKELNSYTYQKLEETIQSSPSLSELATQGHGTNNPVAARYSGYTTDFQNVTDNKTYFVGGGEDNGETAVPNFVDDVILGHTPFPTAVRDGVIYQLNQNGNREDPITVSIAGQNEAEYERVFVASDFSLDKNAAGAQVFVNYGAQNDTAPALPVAHAGEITTQDGSVISGTITAGEHVWVADSSGLLHTRTNLAAEWKADYALMQSGKKLTSEQRQEANAEAVLENTGIARLSAAKQLAFREDLTRQFDAEAQAQTINQRTLGISATAQFTDKTYIALSNTIRFNESLEELYTQGHGLDGRNVPLKYRGFADDFQNVDSKTTYTGPLLAKPNGSINALGNYVDEVLLGHLGSPAVLTNSDPTHIRIIQQDSGLDQSITTAVKAANGTFFTLKTSASSFAPRAA